MTNQNVESPSEEKPKLFFSWKLEDLAREAISNMAKGRWDTSPVGIIDREIALTLEHMDRLKEVEEKQRINLLEMECAIDTEIMRMETRTPKYSDRRFPEWDKLQRQLQEVETERRNHLAMNERQRQAMEVKLLSLMNRRAQLG